jgi:hypothetical protein
VLALFKYVREVIYKKDSDIIQAPHRSFSTKALYRSLCPPFLCQGKEFMSVSFDKVLRFYMPTICVGIV